ncbi:uncharacterized protein [Littorina saxatilis]|uniref:uncharacterized protein isoform X2 n=1 Tax=Littorina saxatilis TaxID=31220 RepID=UPI0038B69B19
MRLVLLITLLFAVLNRSQHSERAQRVPHSQAPHDKDMSTAFFSKRPDEKPKRVQTMASSDDSERNTFPVYGIYRGVTQSKNPNGMKQADTTDQDAINKKGMTQTDKTDHDAINKKGMTQTDKTDHDAINKKGMSQAHSADHEANNQKGMTQADTSDHAVNNPKGMTREDTTPHVAKNSKGMTLSTGEDRGGDVTHREGDMEGDVTHREDDKEGDITHREEGKEGDVTHIEEDKEGNVTQREEDRKGDVTHRKVDRKRDVTHTEKNDRAKDVTHKEKNDREGDVIQSEQDKRGDKKCEGATCSIKSMSESQPEVADGRTPGGITWSWLSGDSADNLTLYTVLSRQRRDECTDYYARWKCACPRCTSPDSCNKPHMGQVVYKRKTSQSSYHTGSGYSCTGNNGNKGVTMVHTPSLGVNCVHTGLKDRRAWWMVNLATDFTIYRFVINGRTDEFPEDDKRRMAGLVVTVNGQVCHRYPFDDDTLIQLPVTAEYDCLPVRRGQYVHVQKVEFMRTTHLLDGPIITFCEFEIFVCLPGYYWSDPTSTTTGTCQRCSDVTNCKYYCDNFFGCSRIQNYNIAFKKAIEMSSEDYGNAGSTVDGRTDSRLHYMECTASGTKAGQPFHPYWRVYLNGNYYVNSVIVKPRIDCCANKMKNLNVLVQKRITDLTRVTEHDPSELCKHWEGTFQNGKEIEFNCMRQMLGKYVNLQTIRPSQLLLCEVQVLGYPVTVSWPGGECDRLLTTFCLEGLECDSGKCKVPVGSTCFQTERRQHCIAGTICDAGACKLVAGADCRAHQGSCARGTECDSTSGYKCQTSMRKTCSKKDECARYTQGVECDHLKQCGKGLGVTCVKKECVAGAKCENSKCQCTVGASTASGKICVPEAGRAKGDCSVANCTANAVCDGNNQCQCSGTYGVFRQDFTCSYQEGQVGSVCSVDGDCSTAMVCEAQKCRLDTGQHCENNDECRRDDVCDDNIAICRLDAGSRCNTTDLDACRIGTTCQNNRCYLEMGQECDTSNDLCITSTGCSTNAQNLKPVCLRAQGQTCKGKTKTLCVGDTLCDKDQVCRIQGDKTCTAGNAMYCQLGTKCEGGSCKLILGAPCKSNGTQCSQGLVCDMVGRCRIPKDGTCSQARDGCLAGAKCSPGLTCQCETDNCKPATGKIGGTCQITVHDPIGQESCKDPLSLCNPVLLTCQCGTGYAANRHNFTCGQGAGASCNASFPCAAGFVCGDAGHCTVEVGETCEGRKSLYCTWGSVCDKDEFCRLAFDENCLTTPDMCVLGTKCDSTGLCKIPVNKACSVDDECEAGSVCPHNTRRCTCSDQVATPLAQGQGCDPKVGRVGGKCNDAVECVDPSAVCDAGQQKCECSASYETNQRDFSCTKRMGETCMHDDECRNGAYCDSLKKCSLKLGEMCRGELKRNCGPEAICERNDHCSIGMHGDCSGENLAYCQAGLFCDSLEKCRLDVGRTCNVSSVCPAGAACVDSVCECVEGTGVLDQFLCKPAEGRVGSTCGGVSSCTVPGAECVDEECRCDKGVDTTQDFGCAGKSAASFSASPSSRGMVVGGSFGALVILMAVVAFFVYRRKKASLDWKPEITERRLSLAELNKLSSSIENDPTQQADSTSQLGMTSPTDTMSEFATDSAMESTSMVGSVMTSGVTSSEIQSGMDTTSIAESEI